MNDSRYYDTIERWNTEDPLGEWRSILVKGAQLGMIETPLMTVLTETEIVIIDNGFENLIFVLDTQTNKCKVSTEELGILLDLDSLP